jgi:hypothetical protein
VPHRTMAKYSRPINKFRLLYIDEQGMHVIGPRGGKYIFLRTKGARKPWRCCQCQGRIDYGELNWRIGKRQLWDRMCEACASEVEGYRAREDGQEVYRPSTFAMQKYPLIEHAYRELDIARLFAEQPDIAGCVLKMIEALARHDVHTGETFDIVTKMVWDLAHKRPISALTSHPSEWERLAGKPPTWRSIRDPDAYSNDGGKTFYRTDRPDRLFATVRRYEEGSRHDAQRRNSTPHEPAAASRSDAGDDRGA